MLTSCKDVLPCYVRILCLRHNTPYAWWHVFSIPPFCKHGLRATLFGRKQTRSSRILFLTFNDALSWRHMKDQIKLYLPGEFQPGQCRNDIVGNYRMLRGLRTVNPEGLPSTWWIQDKVQRLPHATIMVSVCSEVHLPLFVSLYNYVVFSPHNNSIRRPFVRHMVPTPQEGTDTLNMIKMI